MSAATDYSEEFSDVQAAETDWIERRREAAGIDPDAGVVGLAFSGGGIRSATFNLGVLEALERAGLTRYIDYLSSVSGGGYIASCFAWLNTQRGQAQSEQSAFAAPLAELPGKTALHWLRAHGKYLVAERGFSSWTLGASILAATLLNLLVLLPPIIGLVALACLPWVPFPWPDSLQLSGGLRVEGHSGFALLLVLGLICLAGFLVAILLFALVSGIRQLRSVQVVMAVRRVMGKLVSGGIGLLAIGLVPIATQLDEMVLAQLQSALAGVLTQHLSYLMPIATGLFALRIGSNKHKVRLAYLGLALFLYGMVLFAYHLVAHADVTQHPGFYWVLGLSFALACLCDINWISMHGYYRVRLTDSYLPVVRGERGEEATPLAFRLTDIDPQSGTPLPIINANLSTVSSGDKTLRSRGGANFSMTPLYCGSLATGFRRTASYLRGKLALSTAFTISGAAVDPNTYATRSRPVAALMALLNFRLGYWSVNPKAEHDRRLPGPWWYFFIGREMLGIGLNEASRHVHLSDGGHFENLGVYELLRRKCRYIIVSDAGSDPRLELAELGKAVERARVDFGAEIQISPDLPRNGEEQAMVKGPFLVGNITYSDGSQGEILYIKPMMRDHLTVDVYSYWREHPDFPNQSTADQFFDERQFCAYRELAQQLLAQVAPAGEAIDVPTLFKRAADT